MLFSAPQITDIVKGGQKVGKVKVWGVGVSLIKTEIYGCLKKRVDPDTGAIPDGYCHFPKREPSYFRGLTAEEVVLVTNKKGFEEYQWQKKYKRNEPLDCRVYARAAAAVVGMDRWSNERWDRERGMEYPIAVPKAKQTTKKKNNNNTSSFWN
ncbi:Phage terminase large subunit (GpA) [Chitinophaga sp. CF418]|nr:Phage terminase large subunit (GpA) [Chitinophaga sp. CF418]